MNSFRAGLHSLNIQKLFLAIFFTSGDDCFSILVTDRISLGITGAQMPTLSAASAFLMSECSSIQELLSLALNSDQNQTHCQKVFKISLGFSPLHN